MRVQALPTKQHYKLIVKDSAILFHNMVYLHFTIQVQGVDNIVLGDYQVAAV